LYTLKTKPKHLSFIYNLFTANVRDTYVWSAIAKSTSMQRKRVIFYQIVDVRDRHARLIS
jgi:hypothetical protein